jgi:2-C-methyl-D-erythritol 4-phosphate cytidylyltransferase
VTAARARLWAVLAAAGAGVRFGGELPKQYHRILGRPVIHWSLAPLLARSDLADIVVLIANRDEHWSACRPVDSRVRTVEGGSTRAASVINGLEALADQADDDDWIIVHDAARPCLAAADLDHLIRRLWDEPVGGLLALPVADTLKREAGGRVAGTVDRQRLWRALTPQMFRYGPLRAALTATPDVTDESAALERAGHRPVLVPGRGDNLKVTTQDDLAQATAILAARG